MRHILATAISNPATRLLLGVLGVAISWFFGPVAIGFLLVGVVEVDGFLLFVGIGGLLGLLGWGLRVLLPPAVLAERERLRRLMLAMLVLGTVSAGVVAVELGGPWRWIFVPTTFAGVLMALGSLRPPGPNNSSKPTPLRGAA